MQENWCCLANKLRELMMMPTGFRFNPTDEELIQILGRKASGEEMPVHFNFIVERNVYEHEPQDLQWEHTLALQDNERYCYCKKESDSREISGRGWWKATSHVKKIYDRNKCVVGYKRPLTFHRFTNDERKRNKAIKTNWIMHEYSLESTTTEWRLCKIKYKGKPSVQEELENIRKVYRFMNDFESSSSIPQADDFVGEQEQQPLPLDQQQQEIQTPIMSTNYYFDYQLDQQDPSEELFPSLWSWQN